VNAVEQRDEAHEARDGKRGAVFSAYLGVRQISTMPVQEAIAAAEVQLPGRAAPDGRTDPRWQAIIAVGEFIETEPDAVWLFIRRRGGSTNTDLRSAVATCLLEHLLENHFDRFNSTEASPCRANAWMYRYPSHSDGPLETPRLADLLSWTRTSAPS
jgi:hypothetical protein